MPMFLPHLTMAYLWQHHRERFMYLFCGPEGGFDRIEGFWKEVVKRRDPRIQMHPMCHVDGWLRKALPISLHGDAVPCVSVGKAASKSYDAYSWEGLLSSGPLLSIKQYMFGLFEDAKTKPNPAGSTANTMEDIWRHVCWSLHLVFQGSVANDGCFQERVWGRLV